MCCDECNNEKVPIDAEKLHVKHQVRVGRDQPRPSTPCAVPAGRRDPQDGTLAGRHLAHALVPPSDHLALPKVEGNWLTSVSGAIELLSVGLQGARVVHANPVVLGREGLAISSFDGFHSDARLLFL